MTLYTNTATVKGFLGQNAEVYTTSNQRLFVVLSLATKSGYKDKLTDKWVDQTEWHSIAAFGKPAEIARFLKKGDYVEVKGELHLSKHQTVTGRGKNKVKTIFRDNTIRASVVKKLVPPANGKKNPAANFITEDDAA